MKKLIIPFLAVVILLSAVTPGTIHAQNTTASSTVSLEAELNAKQKEVIVLLNKRVEMLRADFVISLREKLRNAQIELVSVLQKQIVLLKAQVDMQSK